MGSGTFSASAYRAYTTTTRGKTTDEIYASRSIHKNLDPKGVKTRESRDSADNTKSTPAIIGIDVTGSMGIIADVLAREGLGTLFTSILDRKPITDPHVRRGLDDDGQFQMGERGEDASDGGEDGRNNGNEDRAA